jgi:pimeloyl-ACP methyl ester carboxylesterase
MRAEGDPDAGAARAPAACEAGGTAARGGPPPPRSLSDLCASLASLGASSSRTSLSGSSSGSSAFSDSDDGCDAAGGGGGGACGAPSCFGRCRSGGGGARPRRGSGCSIYSVASSASVGPPPPLPQPPRPRPLSAVSRSSHSAKTPDGWRLHLHRVAPAGGAGAGADDARCFPVVLCPGLASGGIESFDLDDSVSMAAYLAARGFDVWWVPGGGGGGAGAAPGRSASRDAGAAGPSSARALPRWSRGPLSRPPPPPPRPARRVPDLRGNGRSDRPSWWDRKTWWTVRGRLGGVQGACKRGRRGRRARRARTRRPVRPAGPRRHPELSPAPASPLTPPPNPPPPQTPQVDEHLLIDAPAVIAAVLAAAGAPQLHWVGHSMGGMIAVGALSRGLPCAAALRSVTLLASGCFGAGSWHEVVGPLLTGVTRPAGFHAGHVVPLLARLRGPLAPVAWLTRSLFYVRGNVDPAVARKLLASFLSFIPAGVVAQFMGSLNSPLGISSADGSWNYADPRALARCGVPVFGINGARDLFCPAAGGGWHGRVQAAGGLQGAELLCRLGLGFTRRPPALAPPPTTPGLKTVNLFGGPHRRFLFLGPQYGAQRAPARAPGRRRAGAARGHKRPAPPTHAGPTSQAPPPTPTPLSPRRHGPEGLRPLLPARRRPRADRGVPPHRGVHL